MEKRGRHIFFLPEKNKSKSTQQMPSCSQINKKDKNAEKAN